MAEKKMQTSKFQQLRASMERWMVAVTFAEAGDRQTALDVINEKPRKTSRKTSRRRNDNRADNQPVMMS